MAATQHWASALSRAQSAREAAQECLGKIRAVLGDARPDALFAFVSPQLLSDTSALPQTFMAEWGARHLLGCAAGGIIGEGREVEDAPALSVTAAVLPGVEVQPFHLEQEGLPDLDGGPRPWETAVGVKASSKPAFVVLADPYTVRPDEVLGGLDFAYPESAKVGGLASGRDEAGANTLFLDDRALPGGAAGLAFSGNLRLDTLVAQGCRPIGRPMLVTRCQRNLLVALDGRKPMEVLGEIFRDAPDADRERMRSSLFLGLHLDSTLPLPPRAGDFLIRNLIGQNQELGALAIGAALREGQTVQFHVRDAQAASQDLQAVLRRYTAETLQEGKGEALPTAPAGALLFTCLGRGRHMYGQPDHDSQAFQEHLGPVPLGGFFCNGEIGPVAGATYLHGFTSCFGIFRGKS